MINRGYRYRLKPSAEQLDLFGQFAGVCRLIYNLALEQRRDWWSPYQRRTGKHLSYVSQAKELTALRSEYDWIAAVSQTCQQQALRDLDRAYSNFFKGIASYPSPRRKGLNDSFRFQGREVSVRALNGNWAEVRLPKIGWVRFRCTRPLRGKVNNATVSLAPNGWHISFSLAIEHEAPANIAPSVGIDRRVSNSLALSTGELLSLPAALQALERRKRRAQRVLARRKRGSRRSAKARARVAALAARQARVRKDWHHRVSTDIARRFGTIVLEDLNTQGMTRSARGTLETPGSNVRAKAALNRAILNQGWYLFETLLAYKLEERGGHLCKVSAHYTSQTCSACGTVDRESRKSQASFHCHTCGHIAHADTNAAINILRRNTASMLVEVDHKVSCEARTRRGLAIPENLPASAGGRC